MLTEAGGVRIFTIMITVATSAGFVLTAALLSIVQVVVDRPMLLAERFIPGAGWAEAALLAAYAAVVIRLMNDPRRSSLWRRRIWLAFSIVFFGQLALGLAGVAECLMTGRLHLPIPALIVAGPVYRGEGYFMPVLLLASMVLVGPAWCSHLCYIGAWDGAASLGRKVGREAPRWWPWLRPLSLVIVIGAAVLLRMMGVTVAGAALGAAAFGLGGLAVMATVSRRMGLMAHCTAYCPIGFVTALLGRISPFRIKVGARCCGCSRCFPVCRYAALGPNEVASGMAGFNCTLCGDCVAACPTRQIHYAFLGLSPSSSRTLFVVLAVSLHAVFLGVARI